jgi:hypothetical protein
MITNNFESTMLLSSNESDIQNLKEYSMKSDISLWLERWFLSSNAKDIGTLYLIFALFSGLLGTAFSVLIRLELSGPGVQFIADNQLYNSIITAHAILMIFFMVNFYKCNITFSSFNPFIKISKNKFHSENNGGSSEQKGKYNHSTYISKIEINNPYNNRDLILKITKGEKGVYIFETNHGHKYVGHSINLYNRISSYFMESILKTKARKVLRYFNKHGFDNVKLTVYIMKAEANLNEVVILEQYFIDKLKPNLNVDLVASSSGYHEPMSIVAREKLRKDRGTPVYLYSTETLKLLYIFGSKQHMYNSINIHHNTLSDCLDSGKAYLDFFFISLDFLTESTDTNNLLTLDETIELVKEKRSKYTVVHPKARMILAEFKNDPRNNLKFLSLNSLANHLKGDRHTIRQYLEGKKSNCYRGVWKFSYIFE